MYIVGRNSQGGIATYGKTTVRNVEPFEYEEAS